MPYIGSKPSTSFVSMSKQDLTGSSGGSVTLSHAVANANEVALYINNVRQEPTESYTVSGSTLNFNGYTVSASDDIYVIFLGKAIQTTVPPDGSVTSAKLDTNIAVSGNLTVSGAFTSQGIDDNADAIALTVDSLESVGIGISNPSSYDDGADKLVVGKTDDRSGITIVSSTSTAGSIHFADGTGTSSYRGIIGYYHDNDSMRFYTGGASEKMRINSSGASTFGLIDSSPYVATEGFVVALNNGVKYGILTGCDHVGNREAIAFVNPNGQVGSIRTNGTATSFNTTSDHRLKENVTADWNATTRLKQLNPVRFNFIADADTTVDGFLAHEVQSVVPEAISGEKDAVDDDGNIIPQGIDQSKIVPLLVKTIQELEARITALENS